MFLLVGCARGRVKHLPSIAIGANGPGETVANELASGVSGIDIDHSLDAESISQATVSLWAWSTASGTSAPGGGDVRGHGGRHEERARHQIDREVNAEKRDRGNRGIARPAAR